MSEEAMVETTETPEAQPEAEVETTQNEQKEVVEAVEEAVEVEETIEEKASRLEKEREVDNRKIARQKAANSSLLKKIEELKAAQVAPQQAQEDTPPQAEDFETYDDYNNAFIKHEAEKLAQQRINDFQNDQIKKLEHQKNVEDQRAFLKNEAEYREKNPNYDYSREEFQQFLTSTEIKPDVEVAIYSQAKREGNVAEIINYFGENGGERLSELEGIIALSPVEAAVEIYKIQQALSNAPKATKVKQKLPEPQRPVKGGGARGSKPVTKMSPRELLEKFG